MMLFVFDVASDQYEVFLVMFSINEQTDWEIYQKAMDRLNTYSQNAMVYVLVHKMDKIRSEQKKSVAIDYQFLHRNQSFTERKQKHFLKESQ